MTLWFQDELRVGQKGRLCHRWWTRGERPPGVQDQRHQWANLVGAARPGVDAAFALVLTTVNTKTIQIFLDRFAETLAEGEHAVMVPDGAGWHGAKALTLPPNVTLAPRSLEKRSTGPFFCPGEPLFTPLNPMERIWLFLRERSLSLRLREARDAIIDACCAHWNAIADDADYLRSPCLNIGT